MRVNSFEGARRIALAAGFFWVAGCLAFAIFSTPHASLTYAIDWPGQAAKKAERCAGPDATRHISADIGKSRSIGVTLCFTAHESDDGRMLIPYERESTKTPATPAPPVSGYPPTLRELYDGLKAADAKGDVERAKKLVEMIDALPADLRTPRYMMNGPYTSEVTKYTDAVAERFAVPAGDLSAAEEKLWSARLEQWKEASMTLGIGLAIGWALVAGVGWIARGFMGIPRGADKRPDSA